MKEGSIDIIVGLSALFLGVWGILTLHTSAILYTPMGFFLTLIGIFKIKGYYNKTYYLASFLIITISMLILFYLELFLPKFFVKDQIGFYPLLGLLILYYLILIYEYRRRENNPEMNWRNEW